MDPDHIGAVSWLLEHAPNLRIVTTYLGMGKLGLLGPLPPERVYLLNPGQALDVGDRRLVAVRPPTFDAPETTGLFDTKSAALFSSDCFGGLLEKPIESAAELSVSALSDGVGTWTSIDVPWLGRVAREDFESSLGEITALRPRVVLSSHLPPAPDMLDRLLGALMEARARAPFVGPDQAALERMLSAA